MWLHIRGVGEWTNRLYSYFEKEQERLHNGEVPASGAGAASLSKQSTATIDSLRPAVSDAATPQKDFLSKNLARINHSPMVKSSSFDSAPTATRLNGAMDNINGCDGELDDGDNKKDNPFVFDIAGGGQVAHLPPLRPPRNGPGTSKLAMESYSSAAHAAAAAPPKLERQQSESQTAIRKIQATLQRTFSRKGTQQQQLNDGNINDGFIGDDEVRVRECRKIFYNQIPTHTRERLHQDESCLQTIN